MLNAKPSLNQQKYEEPKAKVYNPTLEQFRIQVDSRGFTFPALELTEIPLSLAELVGNMVAYRGLFVVWPNQKIEDLDNVKLQALKNFKEFNDERIRMEQAFVDERRKAGVTVDMTGMYNYNKWTKWSNELSILLNQKQALEPVGSFMDTYQKEDSEEAPKRRGRSVEATV